MATNESLIYHDILRERRQYFIDKVKAPLMKAILIISNRYPEPTRESTKKQMSHILLDIWDEFDKHNTARKPLFKAIRRILICEVEHDNFYSQRMTWFLGELLKRCQSGEWPKLQPWCPMDCWNDPIVIEERNRARAEFQATACVGGVPIGNIET